MKKYPPWGDYHADLIELLKDPERASGYLNASLEAGDREAFLMALRNVLEAQGGITKIAKAAKLNRVSLYKMLGVKGNPGFDNVLKLLHTVGIRFTVTPTKKKSRPKAA